MSTIEPRVDSELTSDRPLQFRLRTLLLFVGAVAVLTAIVTRVGVVWSVAIVWALLLVGAHVGANAWGTRAVHRSSLRSASGDDGDQPASVTGPLPFAPHTRLSQRRRLGWSMPLATLIGVVVGGTLGTSTLAGLYFHVGGYGAVALGGFSAAVLGGFLGFLSSTFLGVTARALSEASHGERTSKGA